MGGAHDIRLAIDAAPGALGAPGVLAALHARLPDVLAAARANDPTLTGMVDALMKGGDEGDYQVFPVCGEIEAQARDVVASRRARILERLDDALGFSKALGWLSPAQILALREIIVDEHLAMAVELFGPDVLTGEQQQQLIDAGVLTPEAIRAAGRLGIVGAAPEIGALIADNGETAVLSADEARELAERLHRPAGAGRAPHPSEGRPAPAESVAQHAAAAARARGGQQIVGLGNRVATDLTVLAISSDNEEAQARRAAVAGVVAEGLEDGVRTQGIRAGIAAALEGDYARDIDRILVTEMHAAMQQGQRDRWLDRFGDETLCAVVPNPDACPSCLRVYTDGGTPRVVPALSLPPSSVNFRRRAADRVACIPPLHPRCKCALVMVPAGFHVSAEGQVLPGAAEGPDGDDGGAEAGGLEKGAPRGSLAVMAMLPPHMAAQFPPLDGVGPHVTILYAELLPGDVERAARVAADFIGAQRRPIRVDIGGLESRDTGNGVAHAVKVDAPGLAQLRAGLLGELEAQGVRFTLTYGGEWWPHATLSTEGEVYDGHVPTGRGFVVDVRVGRKTPDGTETYSVDLRTPTRLVWSGR